MSPHTHAHVHLTQSHDYITMYHCPSPDHSLSHCDVRLISLTPPPEALNLTVSQGMRPRISVTNDSVSLSLPTGIGGRPTNLYLRRCMRKVDRRNVLSDNDVSLLPTVVQKLYKV